jgi:ribulose-5-phosphate 4-epimerase/fuculose-1-phosphate aldolase
MSLEHTLQPAPLGTEGEPQARVALAALYRLIDLQYGSGEGIYNHISMRVPGEPQWFLIKSHSLLYREVTASNLIKVELDADLDESSHVNRPGYVLHSAILSARPDVNCAIHMHTNIGIAMSAHRSGLRMMSQNALRFYKRLGYHAYEGIVEDWSERDRIVAALGPHNIAVMLRNHGMVIVGATARDTFERARDLMIACDTQLRLEAAGAEIVEVPVEICERVATQYLAHDRGRGAADWPAWVRMLDSLDQRYRS